MLKWNNTINTTAAQAAATADAQVLSSANTNAQGYATTAEGNANNYTDGAISTVTQRISATDASITAINQSGLTGRSSFSFIATNSDDSTTFVAALPAAPNNGSGYKNGDYTVVPIFTAGLKVFSYQDPNDSTKTVTVNPGDVAFITVANGAVTSFVLSHDPDNQDIAALQNVAQNLSDNKADKTEVDDAFVSLKDEWDAKFLGNTTRLDELTTALANVGITL